MIGTASPNAAAQLAFADRIAHVLAARGSHDTYLVGGYVRALVMDTVTRDFDVVVAERHAVEAARALADDLGADFYVLDADRGYGRVIVERSGESDGINRFTVDVTPADRGDIYADLSRRDFSIDAMALPIARAADLSALIDPYGGRGDIDRKVLRALNPQVFPNDPVRLLRMVRLASQLGFEIEAQTLSIAKACAPLVRKASYDRQRDELWRILALRRTADTFVTADEVGLLSQILPEIDETRGVEQPREHYWDVFNHLVETVRCFDLMLDREQRNADRVMSLLPWNDHVSAYFEDELVTGRSRGQLTKLTCLLHDVAKPATKTVEPDGRMRFFGHGEQGAATAATVMERFNLSRREVRFGSSIITHHLRPVQLSQDLQPPSRRALFRYREAVGDASIATLYLSMADYLAAKGPLLDLDKWSTRTEYCSKVLHHLLADPDQAAAPTEPLVNGHVLIEELGLTPGKDLGKILAVVKEAVAVGDVQTRDDVLVFARRLIEATTHDDGPGTRA